MSCLIFSDRATKQCIKNVFCFFKADKEFVWSLWKRLQVTNPDLTQAVSLVVERWAPKLFFHEYLVCWICFALLLKLDIKPLKRFYFQMNVKHDINYYWTYFEGCQLLNINRHVSCLYSDVFGRFAGKR